MAWYEVVPHRQGVLAPAYDIVCHFEDDADYVEATVGASKEDALVYAAAFPMSRFFYTLLPQLARAHRLISDAMEYNTYSEYNVGEARELIAQTLKYMDDMLFILERGQNTSCEY